MGTAIESDFEGVGTDAVTVEEFVRISWLRTYLREEGSRGCMSGWVYGEEK